MLVENFSVDYSVFRKTKEEKKEVRKIQQEWKSTMKMFYGKDWKKYNNFPEELKD